MLVLIGLLFNLTNSPIVVDNVQDKRIEAEVSSGTNNNVIDDTTNHNIIVDANISSTGYRVSSIDLNRKLTETVLEHSREYANADFILVSDEKIVFELSDTYKCKSCEKEFKKRMSDVSNPTIKKGGKQSLDLNASMGLGLFTSGISTTKMIDLSSKIGLVCPTKSTFVRNSKVLKKEILDLSNATLKKKIETIMSLLYVSKQIIGGMSK